MSDVNYSQLFADALADVESTVQHPCSTMGHCREMSGCPRCFRAVMRGDIGIELIEVFTHSGVIRITTAGHEGRPCVVSFRGVPLTVQS